MIIMRLFYFWYDHCELVDHFYYDDHVNYLIYDEFIDNLYIHDHHVMTNVIFLIIVILLIILIK